MTTEGREGCYSRGVFLLAHHIPTANEDDTTAAIPLHPIIPDSFVFLCCVRFKNSPIDAMILQWYHSFGGDNGFSIETILSEHRPADLNFARKLSFKKVFYELSLSLQDLNFNPTGMTQIIP